MSEKEFINMWIDKINSEGVKQFSPGFTSINEAKRIGLPSKTLVIGNEFFGSYEVLTVDGTPVYQASSYDEAKFVIYSNRNKVESIDIPVKLEEIKAANSKYDMYLDTIIKSIEKDYKNSFPDGRNSSLIINEIFRLLNLTRC